MNDLADEDFDLEGLEVSGGEQELDEDDSDAEAEAEEESLAEKMREYNRQIEEGKTREEIADFLGLTLETISRQLSALKKAGVVEFSDRRTFHVNDIGALHNASGDDADGGMII